MNLSRIVGRATTPTRRGCLGQARLSVAVACVLALLGGGRALAQTSMGGVSGVVTDSAGAVVPGATVTLVSQETQVTNVHQTNASGFFAFVNVRPGTYVLTVELSGFKSTRLAPFTVGVAETLARNVVLAIGSLSETVEVRAQSDLLQTASAELGNVVEEKVIRDLPIQGGNFTELLLLAPGMNDVSTAQGPTSSTGFGTEGNTGIPGGSIVNASVHGQQNRSKIYYVDGVINSAMRGGTYVVLPSLETLQEFKVQSQSDKAEFGGVLGGVVNLTSKSGANRFSGSAIGKFRNERFQARDPIDDAFREKPEYRQAQFAATLGGPIVKNQTFFFAAYSGWRYRTLPSPSLKYTVPLGPELDGDFSKTKRPIYNPYTTRIVNGRTVRDPFPGNIIPASMISPAMQAFLKAYMVKPNVPGATVDNYVDDRYQTSHGNTFQLRLDHHFSPRTNLFVRWTEQMVDNFNPIGDLGFKTPEATNRNVGGSIFHSFTPSVIMEMRGGIATQPTEDAPLEHELGVGPQRGLGLPDLDLYAGYFIPGTSFDASNSWDLPDLGQQGPRRRGNPNWSAATDVTWLRGKHNFKAGFQFLRLSRLQENQFGQINFSTAQTADPQATGTTGDALASALLGLPTQLQGFVPDPRTTTTIDYHMSTLSGYLQDQWSLRPNLTLTLGLRYDYLTRATGRGIQSGFDMSTGQFLIAAEQMPNVCGSGEFPPCLPRPLAQIPFNQHIAVTGEPFSIVQAVKDNVGPRLGVAWQMNPRTVLRTGYSLMWDSLSGGRGQYVQHQFERGWPLSPGINVTGINREQDPITRIETLAAVPFATPPASPWNLGGFFNDPQRKNAYSHQFHVEVQRELTHNLMTALAYVGARNGRMEFAGCASCLRQPGFDANGVRLPAAARDQLRPWPHITGGFTYETSLGRGSYDALQFKMQHRFSHGLATVLSYTWSRTMDTSSGFANVENGPGGAAAVQNFHDVDSSWSVASYDVPHILTWGGIWELPAGKGKRWLNNGGFASKVLGNWQVNWNGRARSGAPFTPFVGGDPANIGVSNRTRPDLVGDPTLDNPTIERWFNVQAFAVPVDARGVGHFGNAGRNILRGPGFWNVDLGLRRAIPIRTGMQLEVRVDAYNVFNHINYALPANNQVNIQDARAGQILSTAGLTRTLEGGLRLIF
jgi:outer membrane receptor protein involved in Fe transport